MFKRILERVLKTLMFAIWAIFYLAMLVNGKTSFIQVIGGIVFFTCIGMIIGDIISIVKIIKLEKK